MLDSTGIGIGTLVLATIACLFFNPVLALIPFTLAFLPLAFFGARAAYKHVAPPVQQDDAPSVPTTSEASYDPRATT